MIGQFLTDNFIFDKRCYFPLLEKLGYWEKGRVIWNPVALSDEIILVRHFV
jgi:hypothetical protein